MYPHCLLYLFPSYSHFCRGIKIVTFSLSFFLSPSAISHLPLATLPSTLFVSGRFCRCYHNPSKHPNPHIHPVFFSYCSLVSLRFWLRYPFSLPSLSPQQTPESPSRFLFAFSLRLFSSMDGGLAIAILTQPHHHHPVKHPSISITPVNTKTLSFILVFFSFFLWLVVSL